MNDNQMRKYYQQGMKQQEVPEDLVQSTIQKMHQERERLHQTSGRHHNGTRSQHSFVLGGLTVAAAAFLGVYSISQNDVLKVNEFTYQPDMRLDMAYRADGEGERLTEMGSTLETILGSEIGQYKRTSYQFNDFSIDEGMSAMWVASATYDGEADKHFQIIISSFPTTNHQTLTSGKASRISDIDVFAGVDSRSGDFFAVWQQDEYYVQLQLENEQNWTEKQQFDLLKLLIESLH